MSLLTTTRRFCSFTTFFIAFCAETSFSIEISRSSFGCFLATDTISLIISFLALIVLTVASFGTRRSAFLIVFPIVVLTSSRRIRCATTVRRFFTVKAFLTAFWAATSFSNGILRSSFGCFLASDTMSLIISFLALTVLAVASFGMRRTDFLIAFLMIALTSSLRIRWATTRRRLRSIKAFLIAF